jgi:hypothetical protein
MPLPLVDEDTGERQTLDEILDWRDSVADALVNQRASVLAAIRTGESVPNRYLGMTQSNVDDDFDAQHKELDRLTVLNLVASAEASVRIDYFSRVGEKRKDPLARKYKAWHKNLSANKQLRPDFEGGILDVLKKENVMDNNIIGNFRECLRPRHWVGHGRYWAKPIEVDELDPLAVYDRAKRLISSLPA